MHFPPLPKNKLVFLSLGTGLATFLEVLDISITNVSLPVIAGNLDVSVFNGTWVISGYAVSNAIMILLAGFLARRFGEVRFFVVSILLFVLFSTLCGVAPTFNTLVIFRVCQGAVAGPLIPLSQSLLLKNYPPKRKALALGIWSVIFLIGPMIGPVLGGVISDTIGWRWLFWVNIPAGLLAAGMCWTVLRHRESERHQTPLDFVGIFLLVVGVGSFQIMLDRGNNLGWFQSKQILALLIIAIVGILFFVIWTATAKHPIVDLTLYKIRNFAVGSVCNFFAFIAIFSGLIIYPLWLETQMGYTAIWAGLAVAPFALLILAGAPFVELLIHKVKLDLRVIISISFLIFMSSCLMAAHYNTEATFTGLLPPRLVIGLALAFFFVPGVMLAMSGVDHERLSQATSLFNFPRILGTGMGSSIGVAIMVAKQKLYYNRLIPSVTETNDQVGKVISILKGEGMNEKASLGWIHEQAVQQSYILSLNDFYHIFALVFVMLIVTVWFAKPPFSTAGLDGGH